MTNYIFDRKLQYVRASAEFPREAKYGHNFPGVFLASKREHKAASVCKLVAAILYVPFLTSKGTMQRGQLNGYNSKNAVVRTTLQGLRSDAFALQHSSTEKAN